MAIREVTTPYLYSGQGRVLLSKRGQDGVPEGYVDIGRVPKLAILETEQILDHFESACDGGQDDHYVLRRSVSLELDLVQLDAPALALIYRGEVTPIAAGFDHVKKVRVRCGFKYGLDHIDISSMVITNEAETVTFVAGENYDPDLVSGSFEVFATQLGSANNIVDESILMVKYNSGKQNLVTPYTEEADEYCFRFEGVNTAEGDLPVVLECFRVTRNAVGSLAQISSGTAAASVTLSLLKDTTRPENEQFFRVMTVK